VIAVLMGTGLAMLDGTIVTVALPTMARDLKVEASSAVLIVSVYQLTLAMILLPCSALGIHLGLRRVYQYGQLILLLSTALCFFARSLPYLLVVRIIQALGAGAVLSVSSALTRSIYPKRLLGLGLSLTSLSISIASALAPSLGGLVLLVARWPWIFVAVCPMGILSLLLGRRSLPDNEPRDEPFDVLGAVLCALTIGLLIAGLEGLVHGDSPVIAGTICLAGLALAINFVRRELASKLPILPVDLLMRPVIGLSSIGALASFMGSMLVLLSLPFRLQQQYGWSTTEVGAVITAWPATMAVVAPTAGMLSDRFPAAILGAVGMVISICGLLLLAFLPSHPTHADLIWRTALIGAGYGLFMSPNARLIIHAAPHERAASAGGLVGTTRLMGQTLGATLLAALLASGIGHGAAPALTAAGLALIAMVCSLARLRSAVRVAPRASVQEVDLYEDI
jgi:DHA2 family multidrug resistance protein-like MFS transporter